MSVARRYVQPPARTSRCMRLATSFGESFPVSPSSYLLGQGAGLNTEVSLPLIISVTANSLGGSVHENSTGIGRTCDEAVD